jgi:Cu2+-exporting ATPase
MKHTYTITGMTCNGCRSSVEKALNSIRIEAVVSLDPPIATLLMKDHIPLAQLQETLSKGYSISMESPADTISETSNEPPVKSCCSSNKPQEKPTVISPDNAPGKYYCPMHCGRKGL